MYHFFTFRTGRTYGDCLAAFWRHYQRGRGGGWRSAGRGKRRVGGGKLGAGITHGDTAATTGPPGDGRPNHQVSEWLYALWLHYWGGMCHLPQSTAQATGAVTKPSALLAPDYTSHCHQPRPRQCSRPAHWSEYCDSSTDSEVMATALQTTRHFNCSYTLYHRFVVLLRGISLLPAGGGISDDAAVLGAAQLLDVLPARHRLRAPRTANTRSAVLFLPAAPSAPAWRGHDRHHLLRRCYVVLCYACVVLIYIYYTMTYIALAIFWRGLMFIFFLLLCCVYIVLTTILPGNWAVAKKFAEKNNYTVIASSEMIAYGLCNLVGSFFQSYVVAGGFARSAVNAEGGAQTPLAGLISGICILISLQFFTSLFYYLPLATLGAIIVVSVVSMMDFQKIFFAYRKGFYQDFVIILGSLLSTFWLGVAVGLMCGIALSVGRLVYSTSSAEFSTVTVTVDTGAKDSFGGGGGDDDGGDAKEKEKKCGGDDVNNFHLPDINEETSPLPSGSFRILQMSSLLYFGNLDNFKDSVQEASRSLVQALRGEAVISLSLTQTTSATTTAAATAATCVFGAIVVDAASWGHYLELPSASALDELRIALLAPKPLHVYVPPPSPSPSSTPSASPSLSPSSLPLSSVESSHSDATIVVKLGLVNCHPSVLKMLAALGTVEKIGVDMIFSSTEDCLRNCDYRLQLMMHNLREDDEEEEKHDSKESNDEDNTNSPTRRHHDSMLDDDNVDENIALMNMPPPPPPSTTTNNITYMKIPSPTEESIATVIYDHPEENI